MLRELHIQNLAVIEDARIDLRPGLNAFTGQTGAGKSLILGAFEVLLGLRGAGDLLRSGAEQGRVSGVFDIQHEHTARAINEIADLDLQVEQLPEQLLITRKLFSSGRTSVSVNGQPATRQMLERIGELLVDVHGQHDHQYLLKPAHQLLVLDRYARTESLRQRYAALHHELTELRNTHAELAASASLRKQQLELYEFQAEEIDNAEPTEGEFEELTARHRVLSHLERIGRDGHQAHAALYESDGAAIERLQMIGGILGDLAELDEELQPVHTDVKAAVAQLQDAAFALGRYLNRLELDPAELEEVESRLNTLNRLIVKYGPNRGGSLADLLAYREQIGEEISKLRGQSDDQAGLTDRIAALEEELMTVGRELSAKRRAAADELCPRVEGELTELGMAEAPVIAEIESNDQPGESPTGLDRVELLVQANPGQDARPLRQVASGGELSRIMLALKSILADGDRISVLVFDEIDANIGGRLGSVIGEKLRRLAGHHQVLCITHLPQIAAFADHHLRITKHVEAGETHTAVTPLDGEARIDELAEMLTGQSKSKTTRRQAEELLAGASERTENAQASSRRKRTSSGKKRAAA